MFALVQNDKIVFGPRTWSYSMFKTYFDDNNIDASALSREAPSSVIVTDTWKILPVTQLTEPSYNPLYEQLAGPYYTINADNITGYYDVVNKSPDMIKGHLKELVTANRYTYEVGDVTLDLGGTDCTLFTSREDRTTYLDALMLIPDDVTTYNFKFKNGAFKAVNKAMLQLIVFTVTTRIQSAFDWESEKHAAIEACTTVEELQAIETRHPTQIV